MAFKAIYHGWVPLAYYNSPNWGDALSPVVAGFMSGRPVKYIVWQHQHRYLAIGSILQYANGRAEVWGSGFLWGNEKLNEPPQAVHAVRGPRSRAHLLSQGIDCPEVYGDPALLLPRFFNPLVEKKYAVGIVPHYIDKDHSWMERYGKDPEVRIIDVEGGVEQFVEAVKSCELVVSSSLHGLICADSYGIPNLWVEFSDRLYGRSFKFLDYFESVGRDTTTPVWVAQTATLGEVTACHRPHTLNINLRPLIVSCPFIDSDVRGRLLSTATA
jgi:pyruvyltransferase